MHLVQFVSRVLRFLVAERLVERLTQAVAVLLWTYHFASGSGLRTSAALIRIVTAIK